LKALFRKAAEIFKKVASACKKAAVKCVALLKKLDTKSKIAISLMLVIVVSSTAASATLAKYSWTDDGDIAVSAKSFYFESNLLKTTPETYNVYSDSITFDLMNYPDNERTSEVDIQYTVTITSPDGGSLGTGTNTEGTIKCKVNANDEVYTPAKAVVKYSGLTQGKTYVVTATANAPYTKTISASFYMEPGNYSLNYEIEDKIDYVLLTFSTLDYLGSVTITWQEGYVPDNSEPIMASAVGTSHPTTVSSNTTYTIKFYKTGSAVFNQSAFTVTAN